MIAKRPTIENYFADPSSGCTFRDQPSNFRSGILIAADPTRAGNLSIDRAGGDQSPSRNIVDNLSIHMPIASEHRQTRTPVCIANNAISNTKLSSLLLQCKT
jgi:hypothetical protein